MDFNFVAAVSHEPDMLGRGGVQFHIRTWSQETDAVELITMPWSKVGNWYRGFVYARP